MKYLSTVPAIFLIIVLNFTLAQEQHNFLGAGGELLPEQIGPYYFIEAGNSTDAFARVDALAGALGIAVSYDPGTKSFIFQKGERSATFKATTDIQTGLVERTGALSVDGELRDSPQVIVLSAQGYVAINPLITALGGEVGWDEVERIVMLDFVAETPLPGTPEPTPAPNTEPNTATTTETDRAAEPTEAATPLERPRLGTHADRTRVAFDLPEGAPHTVLVSGSTFVITFPGMQAEAFNEVVDDPFLSDVGYTLVDGIPAFVAEARYPLSADGQGYQVGVLPVTAERPHETLFVDFSPNLQGESVETLQADFQATSAEAGADEGASEADSQSGSQEVQTPTGITHTVVIDPGHGGVDPGAQGYASEEEVVLVIALKVRDLLEESGVEVIMTRNGDYSLQADKRDDLAARADLATSDKHNLFVSIHANAAEDASAQGVETYVFGEPLDSSLVDLAVKENGGGEVGAELTEAAQDAAGIEGELFREEQFNYSLTLADMVQQRMVAATGAKDRGVQKNVFFVVRNTRVPAILVETGFVSNPEEGPKLATYAYQMTLAEAIADGIISFFEQGGVFAQQP